MCSYQFAKYDVTICDSIDGTQLSQTSAFLKYSDGEPIDILLQITVKQMKILYANLIVSSLNFKSLQTITFFSMLDQLSTCMGFIKALFLTDVYPNYLASAEGKNRAGNNE